MALPKEPRQKMINLMYLVLTALLALNVSAEILNAFKTVDNSLMTANGVIEDKNQTLFKSFQEKLKKAETKDRAEQWWPKAEKAKGLAESLYSYLEGLKVELKKEAGLRKNDEGKEEYKEDDLEAATRLFVESPKGKELLGKLTSFKTDILGIDPEIKTQFEKVLPLDLSIPKSTNSEAGQKDWAYSYFHMTPTIAAITILSKFENDVKNSESQVVEYCHKKIGDVEVVFDAYTAFAGTNSQYLMPGQELTITAGVGAFSKAAQPQVSIDGASVPINATSGAAEYKTSVGGPGSYSKKVRINFFNQSTGKPDFKEVDVKYTVGSPTGLTITPDAIKVLYIGLDNPVSITGGSKGAEAYTPSISQGSITNKGSGHYSVSVNTPGTATISVATPEGKTETVDFKVKNVPPPTPKIGRLSGGRMASTEFKAQQGLRADLENFVFDGVKYDVVGFTVYATGKGFEASGPQAAENNGAYFGNDAKRIIDMCKGGSTVVFDRIKVSGPGGTQTLPQTVAFNLY